ncbi:uncharacterized protein HMPREF1541_08043 [Cyphellophora europaea CBS 101466]|uniref:Cytochrome P450 monooxygenase n=1 Tax=Cyphellophora europaea (strain CBS 101466) TaxID=1220924 RepID=W2RMX5_CYPE1|nr:uncharacterized protein HMPREF1541_08043 [Cyphellophora europaea CBS 101466]ETN37053.1 hypothetical protein HMPREF1541_08043 [Cyphellophora europaea CBS 101466]
MLYLRDAVSPLSGGFDIIHRITLILGTCVVLYAFHIVVQGIINVYFHPLSHVPGPKLWIAFPFVRFVTAMRGTMDEHIRYWHGFYPIIRISPNELSFTSAEAWIDIHGPRNNPELPRDLSFNPGPANDIIRADTTEHSRFRKALSYGFSDRGLRAQEDLIRGYVDLLMTKLRDAAEASAPCDLVLWFNYLTFDIIGDLAYGQSFNCLKSGVMHEYIANLLKIIPTRPIVNGAAEFPVLAFLLKHILMSKRVTETRQRTIDFAISTINKRLNDGSKQGRADFVDAMSRNKDTPEGFTELEMASNALIILAAGSETTATLLAGATYFLLRNPHALARATNEVRTAFQTQDDITIATTASKIPYTLACIEETFRIYPPVANSNPRVTVRPSTTIAGLALPAGTKVGVHHSAAYWSPRNFTRPRDFLPERWLKENQREGAEFAHDNRAALQPFNMGPRNCIGQNLAWAEIRLVLARLLWGFDLSFADEAATRDWEVQKSYTVWIKKPLPVMFRARDDL